MLSILFATLPSTKWEKKMLAAEIGEVTKKVQKERNEQTNRNLSQMRESERETKENITEKGPVEPCLHWGFIEWGNKLLSVIGW